MQKSSTFQLILLLAFGFAAAAAVLMFAGVIPSPFKKESVGSAGTVVVWGTVSKNIILDSFNSLNKGNEDKFVLTYVQKNAETFGEELTEALASGYGPDVILAPHEIILSQTNRIYPYSINYFPKRNYYDVFIDGARLFETDEAYFALPVAVDPLVLYYNKEIYKTNNLTNPPATWEEFVRNQSKLTSLSDSGNLNQSAVALGTFSNITNAKDIFSLLLLQAGNPIVYFDGQGVRQTLAENLGYALMPAQAALEFFVQFADPAKTTYSWHRSWPSSSDSFLAGKLVNYFGFASEYNYLKDKNPHLNFDVAEVPQQNISKRQTFGRFYGLAIMKSSSKIQVALSAVYAVSVSKEAEKIASAIPAVSVKREILAKGAVDPYQQIFYEASIVAKAWLDFRPTQSAKIFSDLVDNYSSGRLRAVEAIKEAAGLLNK